MEKKNQHVNIIKNNLYLIYYTVYKEVGKYFHLVYILKNNNIKKIFFLPHKFPFVLNREDTTMF